MITAIFFIFVNNIYHFLQSSNNFAALYYNGQNHIYFIKDIAKASWQMAKANVNSTCRHYVFQDKVPKEVYKLSKNK